MIRTYKYRLRPNTSQTDLLWTLFSQSRRLYNNALEQRITTYKETGKGIRYTQQWTHFRDERNNNPDSYGMLNATSVQQMLRRLDKAYAAFFKRIKAGETPGHPRFKNAQRFKSIEYRYGDGCKLRPKENGQVRLYIQNVGEIKVIYHRAIPETAGLKHLVLKHSNNKWYVCLMLELPDPEPVSRNHQNSVGIDMGIKSLLATSDGVLYNNPHWLRESLAQLRVIQRTVARRKKGSKRWYKAVKRVSSLHEKIANQRADYWHKVTRSLAEQYSYVALEELNLKFMNRNKHLSLSSYDTGLGLFTRLLSYKVEETGGQMILVNPAYTSQACSGCGSLVEKDLSVRVHKCPHCGLTVDRDINAARNILYKAVNYKPLGLSGQDVTYASGQSVSCEAVALQATE